MQRHNKGVMFDIWKGGLIFLLVFFSLFNINIVYRSQLGPNWNRVSKTTKQLLEDLQELRKMLDYMLRYDCVTFLQYLEAYNDYKMIFKENIVCDSNLFFCV